MSKAKDKRERAAAEDAHYEDDFGGSGRGGGDGSKPKDDENSPTGNEDYYEVNERRGASDSRLVTTQKDSSLPRCVRHDMAPRNLASSPLRRNTAFLRREDSSEARGVDRDGVWRVRSGRLK